MNSNCVLILDSSPAVTYASEQNFIPVINEILFENKSTEQLNNITLNILVEPQFASPQRVSVALLKPNEVFSIENIDFNLKHDFLSELVEAVRGKITIQAISNGEIIAETHNVIELLAYDQWAGMRQLPELLAAFSQPNCNTVAEILKNAAEKLLKEKNEAICGYQNPDRQAISRQLVSIYSSISERTIHYSNPPASFTDNGQKIRLPDRIVSEQLGTCLDITMLFVSCLEQAGLNPLILLEDGHSWVACWLLDKTLTTPTCDDRQAIRKRADAGELVVFETTTVTPQSKSSFSAAMKLGIMRLDEGNEKRFDCAIDVKRSRGHKILPLPVREKNQSTFKEFELQAVAETRMEEVNLPPLAPEVIIPLTSSNIDVKKDRIIQWKSKLLDLTLRNRQLNFKESRQTISLYYPQPEHVEDLIADGKKLKIKSLPDLLTGTTVRSTNQQIRKTAALPSEEIAREAFSRGEILAEVSGEELENRLTNIFRTARTALEEGGANTLYLVIGMLQWVEKTDNDRMLLAPIIMVPVTLERKTIQGGFTFRRHDDETIVNPTLIQLLEQQFSLRIEGITGASELPLDESGVDVTKIWAAFRNAVIDLPGFEVRSDLYLGMFTFTKYLMWKDLNDRTNEILKSPLVRHLANHEQAGELKSGVFPEEQSLDKLKQPNELFVPDNCDSSQLAAVCAAADGLDFVLEGPPGTGKSQTITNIIADKLARGQTVLFVSEKIAALSVVHERLKKLGLGPFLLELHSSKASKSAVLQQFEQSLQAASKSTIQNWQIEADRIARIRNSLNEYVKALHTRHKNGLSVYEAVSLLITNREWKACSFAWQNADSHTMEFIDSLHTTANRIKGVGPLVSLLDKQMLARVTCCEWSPGWQSQLLDKLNDGLLITNKLNDEMLAAANALCMQTQPSTLEQIKHFDRLCGLMHKVQTNYDALLEYNDAARTIEILTEMVSHGQRRNEIAIPLMVEYHEDLLKQDAALLLQDWRNAEQAWWLPRFFKHRGQIKRLRSFKKVASSISKSDVAHLLERIIEVKKEDSFLDSVSGDGQKILRSYWRHNQTNWVSVIDSIDWLKHFSTTLDLFCNGNFEHLTNLRALLKTCIANGSDSLKPEGRIGLVLKGYRAAFSTFHGSQTLICSLLTKNEETELNEGNATLYDSIQWLHYIVDNIKCLKDWCLWNHLRKEAVGAGCANFIKSLENGTISFENSLAYFQYSYANWWVGKVFDSTPVLRQFSSIDQEGLIKEFKERDELFTKLTRQYIYAKLASRIPSSQMPPPGTPLGILKRELQKKAKHMPVRKLLATLSGVLPELTPCLLMSPLSVAQYLNTSDFRFDLIIFDEASQIPTWDAVGAIARGEQVIVVGDPKQLPPTNFFNKTIADEGEQISDIEDLESILDECIGSGLITHTLKWHYRSKRESLIAFSNCRYYQSRLITFPSPVTPDCGVTFHHVNGVYQRAGARTNRREAEAVIEYIKNHFNSPIDSDQSIGVVTFSQAQQGLIEDLLDEARIKDTNLDQLISSHTQEPLFIKNLENVQGDERDVILFSICYGPDEAGRVYMNFGPLNQNGGHRRLNVAVTRAKSQIHIFSTLRPEQIDGSKTRASGVMDLKLYLEYALKGASAFIAHNSPTGMAPESLFEQQVIDFLRSKGWEVHPQVGCSSYRIDIGIVDPRAPGRYLMAIECDGASYHSAATARDRDKLRQLVLERLGWKVHRIWSTEWWTNPMREQQRVLIELEKAIRAEAEKIDIIQTETVATEPMFQPQPIAAFNIPVDSVQSPQYIVPSYVPAKLQKRNREWFLEPTERKKIVSLIEEVIEIEGPVSDNMIKRRVCASYGFDRIGPKMSDYLDELLHLINRPKFQESERVFFWPDKYNKSKWRDFRECGGRSIQDISLEEIANMAEMQLRDLCVAEEAVIARQVCTLLGLSRMTKQIEDRLLEAIKILRCQNRVQIVPGGLKLIENS